MTHDTTDSITTWYATINIEWTPIYTSCNWRRFLKTLQSHFTNQGNSYCNHNGVISILSHCKNTFPLREIEKWAWTTCTAGGRLKRGLFSYAYFAGGLCHAVSVQVVNIMSMCVCLRCVSHNIPSGWLTNRFQTSDCYYNMAWIKLIGNAPFNKRSLNYSIIV